MVPATRKSERRASSAAPRHELPLMTVIVPVFNEVATVEALLRRVGAAAPEDKQVIVVDDGSTDGTGEILDRWEEAGRIELVRHDRNRGKGAAIRSGLEYAQGRFTIIQDGDLEYDPADYERLLAPLLAGEADVVYGSRYLRRRGESGEAGGAGLAVRSQAGAWEREGVGRQPGQRRNWSVFRAGVSVLNLAVRLLYGQRLTDEATCYKAFPTDVLRT